MVVFLGMPGDDTGAQAETVSTNGATGILAVGIV
jgi:hypothetical protein